MKHLPQYDNRTSECMSTELLSSEVVLDMQNEDGNHDDDQTLKNMEQKIE
jgi:hypothetical protein